MQLGMIGLGRMGAPYGRAPDQGSARVCAVSDAHAKAVKEALQQGVAGTSSCPGQRPASAEAG
jgi:6-phosphogluconate dehydrogenase (decarboxylating)